MSGDVKLIKLAANTIGNMANGSATLTGTMAIDANKSSLVAQPMVKPETLGLSIASEAGKFKMALDSGAMMVKSVKTGEVRTLAIEPGTVLKNNISLSGFEIRDDRVTPKHNFTKADPGMVNIFAHKGPDEAGSSSAGWGRERGRT